MTPAIRSLAALIVVGLAPAFVACGGDDDPTTAATTGDTTTADGAGDGDGDGDAMPPQSCLDAVGEDSTEYVEAEIFGRSCAFSSCHDSQNPAGGLDLTEGNSVAAMAGVPSMATGDSLLVPGSPDDSYLMVVIDHVSAMDSQGRPGRLAGDLPGLGTMPLNQSLLCEEKRDAVAAWIAMLSM